MLYSFWLVGSLFWCCQCFCSPAEGRAGAGEGRELVQAMQANSILESRQSTAGGSGCIMFPARSKLGGIAFYLAFFSIAFITAVALNTGTSSSKDAVVVGYTMILS